MLTDQWPESEPLAYSPLSVEADPSRKPRQGISVRSGTLWICLVGLLGLVGLWRSGPEGLSRSAAGLKGVNCVRLASLPLKLPHSGAAKLSFITHGSSLYSSGGRALSSPQVFPSRESLLDFLRLSEICANSLRFSGVAVAFQPAEDPSDIFEGCPSRFASDFCEERIQVLSILAAKTVLGRVAGGAVMKFGEEVLSLGPEEGGEFKVVLPVVRGGFTRFVVEAGAREVEVTLPPGEQPVDIGDIFPEGQSEISEGVSETREGSSSVQPPVSSGKESQSDFSDCPILSSPPSPTPSLLITTCGFSPMPLPSSAGECSVSHSSSPGQTTSLFALSNSPCEIIIPKLRAFLRPDQPGLLRVQACGRGGCSLLSERVFRPTAAKSHAFFDPSGLVNFITSSVAQGLAPLLNGSASGNSVAVSLQTRPAKPGEPCESWLEYSSTANGQTESLRCRFGDEQCQKLSEKIEKTLRDLGVFALTTRNSCIDLRISDSRLDRPPEPADGNRPALSSQEIEQFSREINRKVADMTADLNGSLSLMTDNLDQNLRDLNRHITGAVPRFLSEVCPILAGIKSPGPPSGSLTNPLLAQAARFLKAVAAEEHREKCGGNSPEILGCFDLEGPTPCRNKF